MHFALTSLCRDVNNTHLRVEIDNSTTVCYVNEFGGIASVKCNELSKSIWLWAIQNKVWISAAHIAGVDNKDPDKASSVFNDTIEWQLDHHVFE